MTPTEADITELPSSPGARLRREREANGLSEQQAADALNLDPTVITVLEANDWAALGAPVFVKGHLKRYASFLNLPEDEIVGAYERSKQHIEEPTLVPKSRLEMEPVRGRPRWPWVVGGTVAFLVAAILAAYLSERGLSGSDDDTGTAGTPDAKTAGDEAPSPFAASTPGATQPGAAPQASDGTRRANANVQGSMAPGATAAAGAAAPMPPPPPGQVSVQLKFNTDSWVEIFDGSGKAVVYDLGKAGSERTLTATAPLKVTLGNAPGVGILVNGRAVPTPTLADGAALARFSVAADGTVH